MKVSPPSSGWPGHSSLVLVKKKKCDLGHYGNHRTKQVKKLATKHVGITHYSYIFLLGRQKVLTLAFLSSSACFSSPSLLDNSISPILT